MTFNHSARRRTAADPGKDFVMKTTKRILLAALTAVGVSATTATPALAGLMFNHSEPLN